MSWSTGFPCPGFPDMLTVPYVLLYTPCVWENLHTNYMSGVQTLQHSAFSLLLGNEGAIISSARLVLGHFPISSLSGGQSREMHDVERQSEDYKLHPLTYEASGEETSFFAVWLTHSFDSVCVRGSDVLVRFNCVRILTVKWALKMCIKNSSPTLNTFTTLFTWTRLITSRRLHKDPGCAGFPQNMRNMTRKHSHRKWKTPVVFYEQEGSHVHVVCYGVFYMYRYVHVVHCTSIYLELL